jgi:hypothetical protein
VGPQRKEKHIVDLIKMVKKIMGPQRSQTKEDKKLVPLLHKLLF